jgi:antitoxin ParD1/3/4
MSKVEKISVALTPEMGAAIRAVLAAGEYASASEVIRDALREWTLKREQRRLAIEELRHLAQEGIDSGPSEFKDIEEIIAEARRRRSLVGKATE